MNENARVALVTGANRGIGLEVAEQLALKGLRVIVGSRDVAAGERVAAEINAVASGSGLVSAIQLDVAARGEVVGGPLDAARRVTDQFGRVDVLINNAGRMVEADTVALTGSDFEAAFNTNVAGVAEMVHAFLPLLRASRDARIVNVSSTTASLELTKQNRDFGGDHDVRAAYSTSKAALNMLTLHYSKAFQSDDSLRHIKINAITPGYVATEMTHGLGTRTVAQGAKTLVDLALCVEESSTGGYFNDDGPLPW